MTFDFTVISTAAVIVVGLVELIKKFLPENVNTKILALISIIASAAGGVGISLAFGIKAPLDIISNTVAVIGLVQTSYNFVLKLLLTKIAEIKANLESLTTK